MREPRSSCPTTSPATALRNRSPARPAMPRAGARWCSRARRLASCAIPALSRRPGSRATSRLTSRVRGTAGRRASCGFDWSMRRTSTRRPSCRPIIEPTTSCGSGEISPANRSCPPPRSRTSWLFLQRFGTRTVHADHATTLPEPCRKRDGRRDDPDRHAAADRGDTGDAHRRDPQRRRRSTCTQRQGEARHSAAGRERQHGAADRERREPNDGGRLRQEHSRLQREEPTAEHRQLPSRPLLRPRPNLDPDSARRHPEGGGDRAPFRRHVLAGHDRNRRDAGRLHRGDELMAALINVPAKARRGEIVEIRTLTSHIMETGFRHTADGALVPRDIITSFTCRYNGTEIFRADLFPAIAANPYLSFFTVAKESGKFEFEWIGDNGYSSSASASITVE